jgi:hypothetical protein
MGASRLALQRNKSGASERQLQSSPSIGRPAILSLIRLASTFFPGGARGGQMRGNEKRGVCLDAAKTARSAPQRCQISGSTACRARRAVSRLARVCSLIFELVT